MQKIGCKSEQGIDHCIRLNFDRLDNHNSKQLDIDGQGVEKIY
jgi:hypothetical protein